MANISLKPEVAASPVSVLNVSSRRLFQILNVPIITENSSGKTQDWEGLAEMLDFQYEEILIFKNSEDPIRRVLESWSTKKGATIGKLWNYLLKLEREDFPTVQLAERMTADAMKARSHHEEEGRDSPVQDPEISCPDDMRIDDTKNLTVNEVRTGHTDYFDAFICACENDTPFVRQLLTNLESPEHELKLCYPPRDLVIGSANYTGMAYLIQNRCSKMIAVLSPDFHKSGQCDFLLKFAHSLAPGARCKKIVPVIFKTSGKSADYRDDMPSLLRHVTAVDYTKPEFQDWFWVRLASSLKERPVRKNTNLIPTSSKLSSDTQEVSNTNGQGGININTPMDIETNDVQNRAETQDVYRRRNVIVKKNITLR